MKTLLKVGGAAGKSLGDKEKERVKDGMRREEGVGISLKGVTHLYMQCNSLKTLDHPILRTFSSLRFLILSDNEIESLGAAGTRDQPQGPRPADLAIGREDVGLSESGKKSAAVGSVLSSLSNLRLLDLSRNKIRTVDPETFPESLEYLILTDNPCVQEGGVDLRLRIVGALPRLEELDEKVVTKVERRLARVLKGSSARAPESTAESVNADEDATNDEEEGEDATNDEEEGEDDDEIGLNSSPQLIDHTKILHQHHLTGTLIPPHADQLPATINMDVKSGRTTQEIVAEGDNLDASCASGDQRTTDEKGEGESNDAGEAVERGMEDGGEETYAEFVGDLMERSRTKRKELENSYNLQVAKLKASLWEEAYHKLHTLRL
ncbi:hypothetical protein HK102_014165 [Quaeritorhiza haematococci]|nr:hypothetical protein HK102_014165 [Quaeritorhiza haematococci]